MIRRLLLHRLKSPGHFLTVPTFHGNRQSVVVFVHHWTFLAPISRKPAAESFRVTFVNRGFAHVEVLAINLTLTRRSEFRRVFALVKFSSKPLVEKSSRLLHVFKSLPSVFEHTAPSENLGTWQGVVFVSFFNLDKRDFAPAKEKFNRVALLKRYIFYIFCLDKNSKIAFAPRLILTASELRRNCRIVKCLA